MDLLAGALAKEVSQLKLEGVRLRFVGSRFGLSEKVQLGLRQAELETASNQGLILNVCFNYGGRWDIVQAATTLVNSGDAITEENLTKAMALHPSPDPDLFIRTGGEYRISNFLLWQSAYAEFFFSPALWPDFSESDLDVALTEFRSRERRFGKTSAQVR